MLEFSTQETFLELKFCGFCGIPEAFQQAQAHIIIVQGVYSREQIWDQLVNAAGADNIHDIMKFIWCTKTIESPVNQHIFLHKKQQIKVVGKKI